MSCLISSLAHGPFSCPQAARALRQQTDVFKKAKGIVRELLEVQSCTLCGGPPAAPFVRRWPQQESLAELGLRLRNEAALKHTHETGFHEQLRGFLCPDCAARLPLLNGTWELLGAEAFPAAAVFAYEGRVREALLQLKFGGKTSNAEFFAFMAERRLRALGWMPAALTAMPLGRERLRLRGYNQSGLIAQELARRLGIPYLDDLICRRKNTVPQTQMPDKRARKLNVKGAFAVSRGAEYQFIKGKPLLLLDDVCTSGASMCEAARVLRAEGIYLRLLAVAFDKPNAV